MTMRRARLGLLLCFVLLATTAASVAQLDDEGRAAYARGDYAAAERAFREAIGRAPADPLLRYHRAIALTQLGRWDDAVAEYEQVLRLRPRDDVAAASRSALSSLRSATRSGAVARRNDEDEGTIRLERWAGGWIVEAVVNDSKRGRFLVDTGASITAISPELADSLGIVPGRPPVVVKLQTMSGETKAPVVGIAALRLGSIEARDVPAVIHEMPEGLDGILGNTFLGRYSVTLNARQGMLTVRRK
jgi:clan AA aspartic protease (TIGR02281 family)